MALHGRALATAHRISAGPSNARLLQQLKKNETVLDAAAVTLARMAQDEVRINPAGEWLLDNYYLVEEQMRMARRHLPVGYSRQLPNLERGPSAGLPRVYDLASEAIAHGDGRIDAAVLSRFVAAYQTITPLTLGELWAIPIMLRLALIDNLRRMAAQVIREVEHHRRAGAWVRRLKHTAEASPKDVVLVVADMARSDPPLSGAFVAELTRGLQGRGAVLAMPAAWIEQWVAEAGESVEGLIHAESQRQAATQVSISNSIGSLRFLDHMDWREFVETMSVVERTLRQDPAGVYARMDFGTRDHYRHVIERLARRGGVGEVRVAALVLGLAQEATGPEAATHVGYYLVDDGRARAQAQVDAEVPVTRRRRIRFTPLRTPLWRYLLPAAMVAMAFSFALLWPLYRAGQPGVLLWPLVALALLAFSELGVALVNWVVTAQVPPRALPRMDLSAGIPPDCRTLVVIPSLLGRPADADTLAEALEVRFLANRDEHLHFALLTDFLDAPQQEMPGDAAVVAQAVRQIELLNLRYAPEHGDRFFLLHRPRTWNEGERCWMGAERKRGKLAALNRLLRSEHPGEPSGTDFARVSGMTAVLANVRYVITLDSDTQLPRDAARKCVAAMAHPLNQPRMDPQKRRVERGYGILQPGMGSSMSGGAESRYRADVRQRTGHRSLQRHRVGRLPGSVRRGLVHRQGHLRGRCVRGGAGRALPQQPDPQPRLAGRLLCARRVDQRRATVRKSTRRAISAMPVVAHAGFVATGSCGPGCCPGCRWPMGATNATRCRGCRAASCSTTCAAAWCRRPWSCCWWQAGGCRRSRWPGCCGCWCCGSGRCCCRPCTRRCIRRKIRRLRCICARSPAAPGDSCNARRSP